MHRLIALTTCLLLFVSGLAYAQVDSEWEPLLDAAAEFDLTEEEMSELINQSEGSLEAIAAALGTSPNELQSILAETEESQEPEAENPGRPETPGKNGAKKEREDDDTAGGSIIPPGWKQRPATPPGLLLAKEHVPEQVQERLALKIEKLERTRELAVIRAISEITGISYEEAEQYYTQYQGDLEQIEAALAEAGYFRLEEEPDLEEVVSEEEEELVEEEIEAELEEEIIAELNDEEAVPVSEQVVQLREQLQEQLQQQEKEQLQERLQIMEQHLARLQELKQELQSQQPTKANQKQLILVLMQLGELDQAQEILNQLVQQGETWALKLQAQLERKLAQQEQNAEQARERLQNALTNLEKALMQKKDKLTLVQMALLKEGVDELTDAASTLEEALQLDPRDLGLYRKAGELLRKAEKQGHKVAKLPVFLNGKQLSFDVPPEIVNNRTFMPIRKIAEALGAEVGWDNSTKRITISKGDTVVEFVPDEAVAYINGQKVELPAKPYIKNRRTLVPLRLIIEAFKAEINWDSTYKTIAIIE